MFGSASTPSMSGHTQAFASHYGPFSFGIPSSVIPFGSFTVDYVVSAPMPSMASRSTYFQGFPFKSGHIHHLSPSLGSFPFYAQGQGFNPFLGGQSSNAFQGWNPTFTRLGTRNHFFYGQQGNVRFSSVGAS